MAFAGAAALVVVPSAAHSASPYSLQLSMSASRASPVPLAGKSLSGSVYVFTAPDSGVRQVRFYVDDAGMSGVPLIERAAPFDLRSTNEDGTAKPLDTRTLANGQHTVTAAVDKAAGGTDVLQATFTVANPVATPYSLQLSMSASRASPVPLAGKSLSGSVYVFTAPDSGVRQVRFYVDDAGMSGVPLIERAAPFDLRSTNEDGTAKPLDTRTLANGQHTVTAAVDKAAGGTDVLQATFTVANPVATPYSLQLSMSASRASPVPLAGKSLSGSVYVFTAPDSGVRQVRFYVDDAGMSGVPLIERAAPFDLRSTNEDGTAKPLDTRTLANGQHTVTAAVDKAAGGTDVLQATFTVANTMPVWRSLAPAITPRLESRGVVAAGKLFAFGGFVGNGCCTATAHSEVYDPVTNTWKQIANLPETLTHSGVAVDGNIVYLVGGYVGNGPATQSVWKYNVATNTWSRGPSLPVPRGAGAAVRVDRRLHFFGGINKGYLGEADSSDHFVLALDGGTQWQKLAALPNPRNHLTGANAAGKIYAIGGQHGFDEKTGNQSQVDVYDPVTGAWTQVASLPAPRGHVSSAVFNGRVIVAGGTLNGNIRTADVLVYNPAANVWARLPSLPAARKSPVVGVVNTMLFAATGEGTEWATATNWAADLGGAW